MLRFLVYSVLLTPYPHLNCHNCICNYYSCKFGQNPEMRDRQLFATISHGFVISKISKISCAVRLSKTGIE